MTLNDLPIDQKDLLMRELVRKPLVNKDQLRQWCKAFLDVDLADCTVSRFSSSNPLDMVWEIYQYCMNSENDSPFTIYYIAGRASQKTLSAAVLQVLLPLHASRSVGHFGGTVPQAKRAYAYFQKFAIRPYIKDFLKSDPTQQKTIFIVDNQEIEIEIQSITMTTVQGAHPNVLSLDELASMPPDKVVAYEDLEGVPVYTQDGKPWVRFGISSRKGKYTVIEKAYEEREEKGIVFKFWTVLENTQRCPDSISGIEDFSYYANALENSVATESEFEKLKDGDKTKYELVYAKKGCFSCPLKAVCAGDLKKQTSKCRTLRPTKSVIQEFKQSDLEWFLSQKMSMAPSAEGLVYPKFRKENFEKTPREIYELFFGKDPGVDITETQLINEMIKAGVKRYAGLDHGYTHPMAVVVVYEDSRGNVFIMNVFEQSGLEPPQVVEAVEALRQKYQFTVLYPDTASPAINKMIKKVVKVGDDFTKVPDSGIQLIRAKLSPSFGPPKMYGLKGQVTPLINNFEKYHFGYDTSGKLTDKPVKEFDDSHDALSYAAQNRWSVGKPIVGTNDPITKPIDPLNPPRESSEAYAEKVNKQYQGWVQEEIQQATEKPKPSTGTQSSKTKTHFWDID